MEEKEISLWEFNCEIKSEHIYTTAQHCTLAKCIKTTKGILCITSTHTGTHTEEGAKVTKV